MKFDISIPRDCELFASTVAALQHEGVKFYVERDWCSDGTYSKFAEIKFGESL